MRPARGASPPDALLLEPPGFMMLNYGRSTPIVIVLAHVIYGAIIEAFVAWPSG